MTIVPLIQRPRGRLGHSPEARRKWIAELEAGASAKDVIRRYGISAGTLRKWSRRWQDSGGDTSALLAESRRPKSMPMKTPAEIVERIKALYAEGLGIYRIARRIKDELGYSVSSTTVYLYVTGKKAGAAKREYAAGKPSEEIAIELAYVKEKLGAYEAREQQLMIEVAALKEALRDAYMITFRQEVRLHETRDNARGGVHAGGRIVGECTNVPRRTTNV